MMKGYTDYKDSGVEWLGEVPAHWDAAKLKHVANVENGSTPKTSVDEYWNGNITWVTPNDLGQLIGPSITESERSITEEGLTNCGATLTPPGSVILSTRAPIGHLALTEVETCTNQGCKTVVPRNDAAEHRFIYYLLVAGRGWLEALGRGSTFTELPSQELEAFQVLLPPLDEQRAIAAYLDRKTEQIDALVAKKQRLIDLLREQRTAVINRTVTQGLDPDAPMQDSGIAWLGEVPAHWDLCKLKYAVHDIIDAEHKTAPYHDEGEYLVARTTNIRDGALNFQDAKFTNRKGFEEWTRRGAPQPGDILFTREAPAGEACIVPHDIPLCLGQRVVLLRVNHNVLDERFGLWSLSSRVAWDYIKVSSQGSTVDHINMSDIRNIPILLPPVSEQKKIAAFIEEQAGELESIVNREGKLIEKLQELRMSLISEVVTGKIDVREEEPVREEVFA